MMVLGRDMSMAQENGRTGHCARRLASLTTWVGDNLGTVTSCVLTL